MALLFTGASTNRIDCGSAASLDNLQSFTYLAWIYLTGTVLNTTTGIICKGTFAGQHRRNITIAGGNPAVSSVNLTVDRATTDSNVSATGANAADVNAWNCWAGTFDTTAGAKLYKGTLSSLMTDVSEVAAVGAGVANDDSAVNQFVGNLGATSNGFPGRIAVAAIWNRVLSASELIEQQFRPHPTSGCVMFLLPGFAGTGTQPDLSGNANNGTVTGATVTDQVPLGSFFSYGDGAALLTPDFIDQYLEATISGLANVSAGLTTSITPAASVSGSASAAGALTTGINAAGSASGAASAAGALTTDIRAAGALSASAAAAGALSTDIQMAGAPSASAAAVAELSTDIRVTGSLAGAAAALAALTTEIQLAGSVAGAATAQGELQAGAADVSASAGSFASASGALTTDIRMAASAAGSSAAAGSLTTDIVITGSAAAAAIALGALSTGIQVSGTAAGVASAASALTTDIQILAAISAQASATAALMGDSTPVQAVGVVGEVVRPLISGAVKASHGVGRVLVDSFSGSVN